MLGIEAQNHFVERHDQDITPRNGALPHLCRIKTTQLGEGINKSQKTPEQTRHTDVIITVFHRDGAIELPYPACGSSQQIHAITMNMQFSAIAGNSQPRRIREEERMSANRPPAVFRRFFHRSVQHHPGGD